MLKLSLTCLKKCCFKIKQVGFICFHAKAYDLKTFGFIVMLQLC